MCKNMLVCVDCHEFFKGLSTVVGRLLMVRDTKQVLGWSLLL